MPVCHSSSLDRLLDYVPDLMQRINTVIDKNIDIKVEEKKVDPKLEKITSYFGNIEIKED